MPKVLHLRTSSNFLGAERVVIELSKRLPVLGYKPIVGVPLEHGDKIPELYEVAKDNHIAAQLFYGKHPYDFSVIKKIRDYVIRDSIDLVHSHGYREDLYAYGSRRHAALIATNHLWKRTDWKLKLYAFIDGYLLRQFPQVVAVSKPIVDDLIAAGIAREKVSLISNGIDTEVYSKTDVDNRIRREFGIGANNTLLVTVSSLTKEKGLMFAIEALATCIQKNPQLHLLIVGTGEDEKALKQATANLNLTNYITFAGRRSDIADILKASDIFLLPSLNEGLPMAMLEAMAAGKAVIATDVGDVSSALNKDCGIVIPPQQTALLSENILKLSTDKNLMAALGAQAQTRVEQTYSASNMAKQYANKYQEILNKPTR